MATNTTNSFTNHTGNNTAGPFSISFDYLAESEVVVTVGGVTKTQTTHYTFPSATTISFTSGNHPANSAVIKFQRNTSVSSKKVDFQDGSVLTEADLDSNTNQLLYSFQELLDDGPITEADLLDEDNMASNSATKAATQQSIKAYVDANGGSGTTNLSYTAGTRELASSSGTNVNLPEATTSNAGLQSSSDKTKLDGIEASATADQTGAEIKTAYEAESNTNAYTDAEKTKLSGIAASANNYSISSDLLDEDNMASNSATKVPSQQSVKAYVDANGGGGGGGISNVVEDTTPQLGGNLDVQASEITTSTTNGNVKLTPNGTGLLEVKGNTNPGTIQLNCENNSHGVKIKGPAHSAAASYTLTLPNTDGSANQVLKTDGSGALSWVDQTTDTNTQLSNAEVRTAVEAASDSNVFTDADHTKLNAIAASANNYVHPNHSGDVTSSGDGATTIADNAVTLAKMAGLARGKIIYGDASGDPAALAPGSANQVLTSDGTDISWAAASGGGGSSNLNINTTSKTVYGGTDAGENLTDSANENVFLGYKAGNTTYGDYNVAIGSEAFEGAGTHTANTVSIGYKAMGSNAGNNNTAVGYEALKVCAGTNSTAFGYQALVACTAAQCVSVGAFAGKSTTSGENITAIGFNSGPNNTSGTNNTYCGRESGQNITTGSNNLCLGYQSNASAVDADNEITLGNSSISALRCQVQSISSLSDRRDKTEINTLDLGLDFINSLKPVKFKWDSREGIAKDGTYEAGFIAQDFQQVQKDNDADYLNLVLDTNPEKLEATPGKLIPILVKAIQELKVEVETLKNNG